MSQNLQYIHRDCAGQKITYVPFIDLRSEPGFEDDVLQRWQRALKDRSFISGAANDELRAKLNDYCSVKHTVLCANGTDALQIALRAAYVGQGDIVLLPDFTFWATYEAVLNVGAQPVLIDIDPKDLQLDVELCMRQADRLSPKAIMVVHLYGWCSPGLSQLREYCSSRRIRLIEDGAQCLGSFTGGEPIFSGADIATTSFYPAKVLGAAGDAGAIFTADAHTAEICSKLANHGRSSHYGHQFVGWNSRLDELQAHYLCASMPHLANRIESRLRSEEFYKQELLGRTDLPISIRSAPSGCSHNGYAQVSIAEPDYEAIAQPLKSLGIATGNIYPRAVSEQPGLSPYTLLESPDRIASVMAHKILNLPLFPYMQDAELLMVCDAVKSLRI